MRNRERGREGMRDRLKNLECAYVGVCVCLHVCVCVIRVLCILFFRDMGGGGHKNI